jgi:GNAT superfamily N-acetyltransferase
MASANALWLVAGKPARATAFKPAQGHPRRLKKAGKARRKSYVSRHRYNNSKNDTVLSVHKMSAPANLVIRSATPGDVPVILQLIRDLATYERAPNDVTATKEQLNEVLFGEKRAAEVLLAFEKEIPVGFAVFFHNFSTWLGKPGLYLEDLFVKPEVRGKGYGKALLIRLGEIARDRGCGRMEWAVLDWNEPAIQFYRKLGAKPMDEWTVFRLTADGIAELAAEKDA